MNDIRWRVAKFAGEGVTFCGKLCFVRNWENVQRKRINDQQMKAVNNENESHFNCVYTMRLKISKKPE